MKKVKFHTCYQQSIKIKEAVMMSFYFVAIIILSGCHYRDIAGLPLSPLNQSNDSILIDNDIVQQWHGKMIHIDRQHLYQVLLIQRVSLK